MLDLSGKTALVTGASRGIGRAIALQLASQGAKLILNYASSDDEAQKTADLIASSFGSKPILRRFDVSDSHTAQDAISKLSDEVLGIHILVNNAGIAKDGLLLRYKDDDWNSVLNTNLTGAFVCARACARFMIKNRWGRIINISSVVGESGNPGQVAYVSAKAGLIGLTKALALELASRNVTVNAVSPGFIETDMTHSLTDKQREAVLERIPLGHVGDPADVANAVGYLASDEAKYITGHVLSVNGGLYI